MIDFQKTPHLMKYMGSKRELLGFITTSINDLKIESEWFCDLFSGTAVVGCSLKDKYNIQINDIQSYTSIFAHTYILNLKKNVNIQVLDRIHEEAFFLVKEFTNKYSELNFDYTNIRYHHELDELEQLQQQLIFTDFEIGFHLFVKYYSGTYWSYNQCIWIDSIRAIAEKYKGSPTYFAILASLIYAMSYTSQSTGHFAQFRDVTESNMNDILLYRHREIWPLFEKKFTELLQTIDSDPINQYKISSLDYLDCLRATKKNTIIYADPPYSSVHYSRFYHAIETLVRYDYPIVKYKGRYREDRHQSPFGKKTEVKRAFRTLFEGVKARASHIILSYSDNGMITQEEIIQIGNSVLGNRYVNGVQMREHTHRKMGRSDENSMSVNELLISYKRL